MATPHPFVVLADGDSVLCSAIAQLSGRVCQSDFSVFARRVPERGKEMWRRFYRECGNVQLRFLTTCGIYRFDFDPFLQWAFDKIREETGFLVWEDHGVRNRNAQPNKRIKKKALEKTRVHTTSVGRKKMAVAI